MTDLSANPDNLIPFFDRVGSNQKASIKNSPKQYEVLRHANICLSTAGQKLSVAAVCGVVIINEARERARKAVARRACRPPGRAQQKAASCVSSPATNTTAD
jgi:hypothetical protein